MNDRVENQMHLEAGLQHAVRNDEFVLHYQPRVSAATRGVVGVEALLRGSIERGLVPPGDFIPLLEVRGSRPGRRQGHRGGLLQNKAWQDAGLPPMRVSVNISSRQFQERVARGDDPRGAPLLGLAPSGSRSSSPRACWSASRRWQSWSG